MQKKKLLTRMGAVCLGAVLMVSNMTGCRKVISTIKDVKEEIGDQIGDTNPLDMPGTHGSSGDAMDGTGSDERNAYLAFLDGGIPCETSEGYVTDEGYSYDGIYEGTYYYREIKEAFENYEGIATDTKYTFVDLGQDGTEEMVVRFESKDPTYFNWNGIFHYEDGKLTLVYSYDDGYRTTATLLSNGRLIIGGSWGAGAGGIEYMKFDGIGNPITEFASNYYWSSFATYVAYDLTEEFPEALSAYDQTLMYSEIEVMEYVPYEEAGNVQICVDGYSTDAKTKAIEEQLVADLVALGAVVVTSDDYEALITRDEYTVDEVTWLDWEDNFTIVRVTDYFWLEYLEQYQYLVGDDGEEAINVLIEPDKTITNVCVYKLTSYDYNDEGLVCEGEVIGSVDEITSDNPLAILMSIPGDLPAYAITYTDENGDTFSKSIEQSGRDGNLHLYDITIK